MLDQHLDDPRLLYLMVRQVRLFSAQVDSSKFERFIELALHCGLSGKLSPLVEQVHDEDVIFELTWVFANIAASSSKGCNTLQEQGIIAKLIALFPFAADCIKDNARIFITF